MSNSRNQQSQVDQPRNEAFKMAERQYPSDKYEEFSDEEWNAMILQGAWEFEDAFRAQEAQEAQKAASQISRDIAGLDKGDSSR